MWSPIETIFSGEVFNYIPGGRFAFRLKLDSVQCCYSSGECAFLRRIPPSSGLRRPEAMRLSGVPPGEYVEMFYKCSVGRGKSVKGGNGMMEEKLFAVEFLSVE